MLYGALEAGGTKMICAVGNENGQILDQVSIPTTTPEETMPKVIEFFKTKLEAESGIREGINIAVITENGESSVTHRNGDNWAVNRDFTELIICEESGITGLMNIQPVA